MASTSQPAPVVCGLGAATAVGLTAWSSAAAVRAGLCGFSEHPFMVDSEGVPMRIAACPRRAPEPEVARRIENCLVAALAEALAPLRRARGEPLAIRPSLLIALPGTRPGLPDDFAQRIQRAIRRLFPHALAQVSTLPLGHAAGVIALEAALNELAAGSSSAWLVAGADSYLDPDTLEWLEETEQLHGAGKRNNAWGFIPGEGAGALLVAAPAAAVAWGLAPLARITGIGIGVEKNLNRGPHVCLGHGLTTAFRGALIGLQDGERVSDVYCDMNGEPYRADEFGFTAVRHREQLVAASEFIAPADCWGDVGAASAPLGMVLGIIAARKGYAKGPACMVWASSDTGERGAVMLAPAVSG